jgi:hypothetical protein
MICFVGVLLLTFDAGCCPRRRSDYSSEYCSPSDRVGEEGDDRYGLGYPGGIGEVSEIVPVHSTRLSWREGKGRLWLMQVLQLLDWKSVVVNTPHLESKCSLGPSS